MVRFENVGLRYGLGPEVLRDLSFRLEPASFQFLTGPSGAGKTSLMRLLFLSLRPTRGLITLFGHDVATLSKDALATLRRRSPLRSVHGSRLILGRRPNLDARLSSDALIADGIAKSRSARRC